MIAALLFVAALSADPAAAPVADPIARPAPIADTDLREFAAIAGRKVAGRPVSGPWPTADKVLLIARDDKGYPVVAASLGFPVRQSLPAPPDGTLAVVRLHQRSETIVPGPTADDLAFVAANKLPLFVIGEWARPAPMWEVAWVDGAVRFRTIGEVGEIGPWRD
ncbi:hypothetical protein [Sphingopyxis sp. LK2115]|uniref:hypothetical protein n=1 Tax=Sphingopyxis sp. LK2115 TaxID=2744558 RepID=UPI0016600E89|nr:hypothetical protein [Sphingopyxis sp. LK2115]